MSLHLQLFSEKSPVSPKGLLNCVETFVVVVVVTFGMFLEVCSDNRVGRASCSTTVLK